MTRIEKKFRDLKKQGRKAFIAFIVCGDPNLAATEKIIRQLEANGTDIIELGVPFSDPLADGPVIQAASQRALKNKVSLKKVIALVKRVRAFSSIPIALFTYYNPVFKFGEANLVRQAKSAGVDGLVIPDLPVEEARPLLSLTRKAGLNLIFFLSPTSPPARIKLVSRLSSGFIYYVSLTGVTGARKRLSADLPEKMRLIKRLCLNKPVCAGFGVSNAGQVAEISKVCDGVIVGSGIVNIIQKNIGKKDIAGKVGSFVRGLTRAL